MTDNSDDNGTDTTTDGPPEPDDAATGGDTPFESRADPDLPDALVDALRERAHPLATTDPGASTEDLTPLDDYLSDAAVVGLGEATHGTREFFRLKHRLIRYLVEEHGCRAIAIEEEAVAATALDDYVVHGGGDAEAALSAIPKWTWTVESVRALLEWLRAFNADRPSTDRVRVYGVDAQRTAGPAGELVDYLRQVDPDFLAAHRGDLSWLADEGVDVEWATEDFDPEAAARQAARARRTVAALRERFDERAAGYVEAAGETAFDRHRWLLRVLEAAVAYRAASHDDMATALEVRDEMMADGVQRVLDDGSAAPVALWAHDEHIRRDDRATEWGDLPGAGTYLADRLGDGYYAVGFDFARGEFQALDEAYTGPDSYSLGPPPATAVTRLLDAVGENRLFVDLDAATTDGRLARWLDAERPKRSLGAIYYGDDAADQHHESYRLPDAFDALLFVAETTRARPVDPEA